MDMNAVLRNEAKKGTVTFRHDLIGKLVALAHRKAAAAGNIDAMMQADKDAVKAAMERQH